MMPPFPLSFIYFISFYFYAKPLSLVDIDTDSCIEGFLPILFLVYLYLFSSRSETRIYLFQSENILSFLYSQFNMDGYSHNIYMPPLFSFFSGILVEYSNGRFLFFFRLISASAFMNENKRKESLIMVWISFLWVPSFSFIFFWFLSFY